MVRHRGMLGGGALLGLLVLSAASRADEAAAVKAVQKLGGNVIGKPVTFVNLLGTKVTDVGLKELKELKSLEMLQLGDTKITDVGLKELKELKSLKKLG